MDAKWMLLRMADRLYEDIKFVTAQNPTQIVDEDGAKAYNALLNRAKVQFDFGDFSEDMTEWAPRTIKYKDALVAAGQLYAMIEALMADRIAAQEKAKAAAVAAAQAATRTPAPQAPAPAPIAPPSAPPRPPQAAPQAPQAPPQAAPPQPAPAAPPSRPYAFQPAPAQQPSASDDLDSLSDVEMSNTGSGTGHDIELYGPGPVRRNEDGTIPFSLD